MIHLSPFLVAFVRSDAASEPASDSERQYEKPFPCANGVSQRFFCSAVPPKISGIEPNLFTAGISEEDPQTRATSSMIRTTARASAPSPPNSVGTCAAESPALASA